MRDDELVREIASRELGTLVQAGALTLEEAGEVGPHPTLVHDLNGQLLFRRYPILGREHAGGFVDMAAHENLGGPLLAAAIESSWQIDSFHDQLELFAANHHHRREHVKLVAYSYPKFAAQVRDDATTMVDISSGEPVPQDQLRPWSLLDSLSAAEAARNREASSERMRYWSTEGRAASTLDEPAKPFTVGDFKYIEQEALWCSVASAQMILDYHGVKSDAETLAKDIGLLVQNKKIALPAHEGAVKHLADVLADTAAPDLDFNTTHVDSTHCWNCVTAWLKSTGPLIQFVPGHARVLAGYVSYSLEGTGTTRKYLAYDPWKYNGIKWVPADELITDFTCRAECGKHKPTP